MLLKLLTILKKETEIMEKLIKYSISNLQLRILSTLFLILPLIFITWYNYIGSIIILFFVSCLSTRELINKKLTLNHINVYFKKNDPLPKNLTKTIKTTKN